MGIRGRLLALTLGVATPLALAGALALWGLWTASRRQLDYSVQQRAELAAVSLDRWVDAQQKQLTTLARYAIAQRRSANVTETLRITATSLTWVDVRVINPEGGTDISEPADAEPLSTQLISELFDDVRRRRMWAVTTDLQTGNAAEPRLALGTPIETGSVAIARVNGAAVRDFFRDLEPANGEVFAVFDSRGRIIYRSQNLKGSGDITAATGAPLVNALGERPAAAIEVVSPFDGVQRIYGLARAGETNFVVAVGAPGAIVRAPARRQFTGYLLFSLLALLSATGAALFITKGIATPLRRLRFTVQSFGEGDTSARAPTRGIAEVAELGAAFNMMAEQTEAREARLTELDRLKSEFVGGISHELRTPLTTIKTLTRVMLRDGTSEGERRDYLEIIAAECDREISLVVKLIDLSKIEAGTFSVVAERVDAAEIARACLMSSRFAAEARNQTLNLELPETLPFVRADYTALRRVICELIESAIKYTPDGGSVTVSVRAEDMEAVINVLDTGRGIPTEDAPYVFDKFFRGRSANSSSMNEATPDDADGQEYTEVAGLGLGLYVARRLVDLMNGSISVESAPGKGSTFTVRLPVWEEEESGARSQKPE
ncbi:MAG: ATP-binding protein [Pyrinomonadaceae bacterium MAG19_C2-C3]|nr:ATP-binding protein [Pyrinomonadaceae bacterium MAG19_C2-C3]